MTFEQLCDMLPADVMWGHPITPDIVDAIVNRADRNARAECADICDSHASIEGIIAQRCAEEIRETIK